MDLNKPDGKGRFTKGVRSIGCARDMFVDELRAADGAALGVIAFTKLTQIAKEVEFGLDASPAQRRVLVGQAPNERPQLRINGRPADRT